MLQKLLAICSLLFLVGCIGPQVDTCITDLNILDAEILNSPASATRADLVKIIHASELQYCVPADASKPDFFRKMQTGDHVYSNTDWGILMHWIEDHKK